MRAHRNETTLAGPCTVSGRGYWSGEVNTLTFLPAPVGHGIRFCRADLQGQPSILATAENRLSRSLRTQLTSAACEFHMIEHVMAALYGLQIDNCEIHCTAQEMPGFDGSSLALTLALDAIGKVSLRAKRETLHVAQEIVVSEGDAWIRCEPSESKDLQIEYRLDYGAESPIGKANFAIQVTEDNFYNEVAPARTFVSQQQAEELQSQGIATHVTDRDLLVFDQNGPVNNELRFPEECARHKALDLLGDLALAGIDLVGRVTASKSGHQLNGQMAERLRDMYFDNQSLRRAA